MHRAGRRGRHHQRLPRTGDAAADLSRASRATAPGTDAASLKAQLEAQQRQIEELKRLIENRGAQPAQVSAEGEVKLDDGAVKRLVDGYLSEKDKKKKEEEEAAKAKAEAEGYKVGTDLRMNVRWNPDSGLVAETTNKDFFIHLGGRFQWDTVAFTQSPALTKSAFGELQVG